MGWTARYLIIEVDAERANSLMTEVSLLVKLDLVHEDWRYFAVKRGISGSTRIYLPLEQFEQEVAKALQHLRCPFLALVIEDDDYVYMFGGDGTVTWRLIIDEELARDGTRDGYQAYQALHRSYPGPDWKEMAAADMEAWSHVLPTPFRSDTALEWLEHTWSLAEDFIAHFFEHVGLPQPPSQVP